MMDERGTAPLVVVAAALIRNGRVLVQQRPEGKAMAGLWEFPGGKLEPGEAAEAALVRELAEELGITARINDLIPTAFATGRIGARALVLLLYRIHAWDGDPIPLEAPTLCWADIERLRSLPMPPADEPLIDSLGMFLTAEKEMEARAGIEPACKDLQSSA